MWENTQQPNTHCVGKSGQISVITPSCCQRFSGLSTTKHETGAELLRETGAGATRPPL